MLTPCPHCQQPLTYSEQRFDYPHCQYHFTALACCPDCQQPLQVLKACGAIDYFCTHGHGPDLQQARALSPGRRHGMRVCDSAKWRWLLASRCVCSKNAIAQ